jgi:hypothetical protein
MAGKVSGNSDQVGLGAEPPAEAKPLPDDVWKTSLLSAKAPRRS